MTIRKIPFVVGEYYHLYNRGVDKRTIFLDENDYKRFMLLLYLCNGHNSVRIRDLSRQGLPLAEMFEVDRGEQFVDIGAWCLMPNHFHILVRERIEGGISMFIEKLSTAYSMYFNRKNERSGSLFEGVFKSKHVDDESYFNWLFSYIHLNPVKLIDSEWKEKGISNPKRAREFMENYKYSSYHDYFIGDRAENTTLNKAEFPEYFAQSNDFEDIVRAFDEFGNLE